mmetsp:Transcript_19417/g.55670  ORF Transcript_19417/g.55670 Transcript_19417/m.55670 type:complete len:222 (-) Transcript_19417:710-1375(-)
MDGWVFPVGRGGGGRVVDHVGEGVELVGIHALWQVVQQLADVVFVRVELTGALLIQQHATPWLQLHGLLELSSGPPPADDAADSADDGRSHHQRTHTTDGEHSDRDWQSDQKTLTRLGEVCESCVLVLEEHEDGWDVEQLLEYLDEDLERDEEDDRLALLVGLLHRQLVVQDLIQIFDDVESLVEYIGSLADAQVGPSQSVEVLPLVKLPQNLWRVQNVSL